MMNNDPFDWLSEIDAPFVAAELEKSREFQAKCLAIEQGAIEPVRASDFRCPMAFSSGVPFQR